MEDFAHLAAVDLGSNSFRLEIGRWDHGQISRVEYLKETVRLGGGLSADRSLTLEAMQRGWECLARFAERVAGFKQTRVRAVATQTLREARNREEFVRRGSGILGYPIEIISGIEEARLIYQGVAHLLPDDAERRLVVDIGGRSTELILGQGLTSSEAKSFRVGCVSWSLKYFPDGGFTAEAFRRAEVAAEAVLEEAASAYPRAGWEVAYGSSGTVGAVVDVLTANGWPAGQVDRDGLRWLMSSLVAAGHSDRLDLAGLKDERRAVIAGGVAVLDAVMNMLGVSVMQAAVGALRHGLLYGLVESRERSDDLRESSVRRLAKLFSVDAAQCGRVEEAATHFYFQLCGPQGEEAQRQQRKLAWAAQLHEVGAAVSHSDSHKHGAYIIDNAELMGFSQPELHRLGLLVLGQRGKLRKLGPELEEESFACQLLALRLAVAACHARRVPDHLGLKLRLDVQARRFELLAPKRWSDRHPQTCHLLNQESEAWAKTSWQFSWGVGA